MSVVLPICVAMGFGAAIAGVALARALPRVLGSRVAWLGAASAGAVFAMLLSIAPGVLDGHALTWSVSWLPTLGVNLSLRLDGLALLFALLISGVGVLVFVYAAGYMAGTPGAARLSSTLMLFMGAMLGVVLSDNVLALFVFWELTSVASYLLIGFDHSREKARKAALQALLVTGLGGLALLVGLLLLARAAGSTELSAIVATQGLGASALATAIVALVLLGCFTKSAQWPFHFWLPSAMAAPTPVSAYLHSSTMVKAGVYLIARLDPALGDAPGWRAALLGFGCATVVVASVLALRQTELKKLLAYTTVLALGMIVVLLGLGTQQGAVAAAGLLLAHALYKGSLFMVAGALTHATGEKDAERLAEVRSLSPGLFVVALLAAASAIGLAPAFGFVAKELALESLLHAHDGTGGAAVVVLVGVFVLGAAATGGVALLVAWKPFVGRRKEAAAAHARAHESGTHAHDVLPHAPRKSHAPHEAHAPHAPGLLLIAAPGVLALLGVAWGLAPSLGAERLVGAAASSITARPVALSLALWHGFTLALALSIVAIALGVVAFATRRAWRPALERVATVFDPIGPASGYALLMRASVAGAGSLTARLQHGRLSGYIATILLLLCAAMWGVVATMGLSLRTPEGPAATIELIALGLLIAAGAALAATASTRLKAVAGLGMIGIGAASLFASLGAPDLALTQVSVDALTIVLLLLAFRRLPELRRRSSRSRLGRDALIGVGVGVAVAAITFACAGPRLSESISWFFAERSVPEGFGRNVVNVILVDFRALDTLGEITVVGAAALGVIALLSRQRAGAESARRSERPSDATATDSLPAIDSPILRVSARALLPIIAMVAIVITLQGHNQPGGGFIGGLVLAAGVVLHALAFGALSARRVLRAQPTTIAVAGLALALLSGLASPGVGFLHAQWTMLSVPLLGELKVGTPLLFDVGVFLVVVGSSLAMILSLLESAAPTEVDA